jgi:hypothetical protein
VVQTVRCVTAKRGFCRVGRGRKNPRAVFVFVLVFVAQN